MLGSFFKIIKIALFVWVLLLISSPVALAIWGIEAQPLVIKNSSMNYEHVNRLRALMESHDPRRMRHGEIKKLVTLEEDLNLMLGYALSHQQEMAAEVDLEQGYARVQYSASLRPLNFDGYLNLSMKLAVRQQQVWLEEVAIGQINIPSWMSRRLPQLLHRIAKIDKDYRDAANTITDLQITQDQLEVTYQWRPDLVKELAGKGRELFTQEQDFERLRFYQEQIEVFAAQQPRISSIAVLFGKLFDQAYQRSAESQLAVAENTALLNALAHYISGSSYRQLMGTPEIDVGKKTPRRYLLLAGRLDLTKHFLLSAFISNSAGGGVADALGLFKEFKDSQGGSGFSFSDLVADKAGTHFAKLATNEQTARALQKVMKGVQDEGAFMPDVNRLPENIQELEFKSRYRSLESAEYKLIEEEITRRLLRCAVYRIEPAA